MADAIINIDAEEQSTWMLEIQYHKGSLYRRVYGIYVEARTAYEFARDRADTDWQKLWKIDVTTSWEMLEKS